MSAVAVIKSASVALAESLSTSCIDALESAGGSVPMGEARVRYTRMGGDLNLELEPSLTPELELKLNCELET